MAGAAATACSKYQAALTPFELSSDMSPLIEHPTVSISYDLILLYSMSRKDCKRRKSEKSGSRTPGVMPSTKLILIRVGCVSSVCERIYPSHNSQGRALASGDESVPPFKIFDFSKPSKHSPYKYLYIDVIPIDVLWSVSFVHFSINDVHACHYFCALIALSKSH